MLEIEKKQAEIMNRTPGRLNDGIDCPKCMNRGYIYTAYRNERNGMIYLGSYECECMQKRQNLRRLRASGLEGTIRIQTFYTFSHEEPWQQEIYDSAKACVNDPGAWWYIGGQPGAGKTHICTAIAGQLMRELDVLYMRWIDDGAKLKATVMDAPEYDRLIIPYKRVDVLYIDDFLKPTRGSMPTDADIRLAYEIINSRYTSNRKTLISSERAIEALYDIDSAIAGRIMERAKGYTHTIMGAGKDWRVKH